MLNIKKLTGSSLRKDILWTVFTQVTILVCAFLTTKIVSSLYSVDDFGQYNIIRRSASVISFTMLAGTGIALPRYLSIYENQGKYQKAINAVNSSIVFMLIMSIIVVLLGFLFRQNLTKALISSDNILLYSLALFYSFGLSASSLLFAYYRGKNNFKFFSISQILMQLLLIISALCCEKSSLINLFLLWAGVTTLIALVFWCYENFKYRFIQFRIIKFEELKKSITIISRYSAPRLIGDFFLFSFSAFPLIYIGEYEGLTNVAYFSVGFTLLHMITPLFSFLGVILLPYVSRSMANGTFSETSVAIKKLSILYLAVSILITLIFWVFMPLLINIFFSEDYLVSTQLSRYLMLSLLPQSLYLLYRNPIDAASVVPYNTVVLVISFVIQVVTFCFSKNIMDYAMGFVLSSFVQGVLSLMVWIYLKRKLLNNEYVK